MKGPTNDFWDNCGLAAIILAILLGMGGCGALWNITDHTGTSEIHTPK